MPQSIFFNRHFHKLHYWFKMLHIELFFLLLSSVGGNAKTPMRQHRGFVLGIKKPPVDSSSFVLSYTGIFKRFYLHAVYISSLRRVLLITSFTHYQAFPVQIGQDLMLKCLKHEFAYLMACLRLGTT